MLSQDIFEGRIREVFPDATDVRVFDISGGCGQSYEVIIVSPEFERKGTLAKHRLVNERLKAEIADLHAFTQKTFTPAQFEKVTISLSPNASDTPAG